MTKTRDNCALPCGAPAGGRRHRVTLQERATGVDADGLPNGDWGAVASVWAEVSPLRDRELFNAQQVQPRTTHKITLDYRPGVTHAMRFLFGTRILNIGSIINPMEANRTLEILAEEKAT